MISAWTKHLKTDEEKERYRSVLHRARKIFDHVLLMIEENKASLESAEISPKAYDNVNWHYRQAHANGYKQALRDFQKLFTLDPKEQHGRQPITARGPLE